MNAGHIANAVALAGAHRSMSRNEAILLLVIEELGGDVLMNQVYDSVGHKSSYLRQSLYALEGLELLTRIDSINGGPPRRAITPRIKLTAKGKRRARSLQVDIAARLSPANGGPSAA